MQATKYWRWTLPLAGGCAYYLWKWLRELAWVDGLNTKCVFITGCDSGFGYALALRLDSLGVPVFAGCLTGDGVNKLRESSSERLRTLLVDVSKHDSIAQAYEFVRANIPNGAELWAVVNNAGVLGHFGPLEYLPRNAISDVFDINVFGTIDVTRTFLPLVKKSGGRVVNMASGIALVSCGGKYPYLLSKKAVRAFSVAFRQEKNPYGIKVACIMPGLFKTNITNQEKVLDAVEELRQTLPQEVRNEFGEENHKADRADAVTFCSRTNPNIAPVVADYEHALFARRPRDEYFPGTDAMVFSYLVMLPSFVVSYLLDTFIMK